MKNGFLKIVSLVLVAVSVLGLVVSGYGLKDVMAEKERKQAEKAEKVEQLETYKEGLKTLEENRKAYEEGKKAFEEGQKRYDAGKAALEKGEQEYVQGYHLLAEKTSEFLAGNAKLEESKATLDAKEQKYSAGLQEYQAKRAQSEAAIKVHNTYTAYAATIANHEVQALIGRASAAVQEYQTAVQNGDATGQQTASAKLLAIDTDIGNNSTLAAQNISDYKTLLTIAGTVKYYNDNKDLIDKGVAAKAALDAAEGELKANRAKLDAGWKQYNDGIAQLQEGRIKLAQGQIQIENAEKELEEGKEKLSAAEKELEAGKEKLAEFEAGEKKIKAAEAEMKKNEDIKKNLEANPQLTLAEAFQKALDDATEKTTKELTARAVILGAVGVAAVLLLIAGFMGLLSKPLGVIALTGAAVAVFALVYTFTGERGITSLQIATAAALAVLGVAYFPSCKLAKAPAKAE